MSRSDPHVKARADADTSATEGSFNTLSKTLEDLEARLTRLSAGRRAPGEDPKEAAERSTSDAAARLRSLTAARRAARPSLDGGTSAMAIERQLDADPASGRVPPRARPAPAPSVAERRLGTIAGEVEQLQMQGATLAMVRDLAADVGALRGEIQASAAGAAMAPRFEEMRASLGEIKRLVSQSGSSERIGEEIFAIMEQLTELTAGNADQASLMELRAELDGVASLVGQMAREESVQAVQRRWDEFESRIADRIELDGQAKRDLRVELERLRTSLRSLATEEQILAVQQRWEEFEARYVDVVRKESEETLTRVLKGELDTLREKLDQISAEASGPVFEARFAAQFDAMAGKLPIAELEAGIGRLSERMGEIEMALVGLPEILQIDQMEARIQALAESVEALAAEVREPNFEHFAVLEERLDEISAAIVGATVRGAGSEAGVGSLERIEARVAELATRVERIADSTDADAISAQLAAMSAQIEDLHSRPAMNELGSRIDRLTERVETLFRTTGGEIADNALETRLHNLAERLEQSAGAAGVDNEVIRSLENQIGRLAEILAGSPLLAEGDTHEVSQRLDALERQFDADRDNVVAAARAAAEEAVRRMQQGENSREGGYVRDLADDLRRLEDLCRQSDERAIGVFDAVHATLSKIVDRLTAIESEIRAEPIRTNAARPDPARPDPTTNAPEPSAPALGLPVRLEPAVALEVAPSTSSAPVVATQPQAEAADGEGRGLRGAIARHLTRRSGKAAPAETVPSLRDRVRPPEPVAGAVVPSRAEPSFEIDAPSIDAADSVAVREMDRPLEPGNGSPDIAALIERVRNQQRGKGESVDSAAKADFIAAARKAAMAAAAEAEALKGEGVVGESEAESGSRRRKPILMAVGAVLLALMAIPLGQRFLASEGEAPRAVTAGPADPVALPSLPETQAPRPILAQTPPAVAEPAPTPVVAALAAAPAAGVPAPADARAETAPAVSDAVSDAAPEVLASEASEAATPAAEAAATAAPTAAAEPAAEPASGTLLAQAEAKLPAEARGALPAIPEAIGTDALKAAAEAGEPMALFEVGLRIMEGRTGPSDPTAALAWFGQAATRGYAPAQYSVGTLFEKGNGTTRDTGAARDWYRLAADQGNIRAMHNLAVLYATGVEGASDPKAAAEWFVRAAEHGMRDSQYNLGILYARGAGVEQNLAESYRWFRIVGAAGDKDAQGKMEEVGKTLPAEQRAEIDARTADWQPRPRVEEANTVNVPAAWTEASGQTASVDMSRAIRNVQAILIKLGYDPGRPDGVVGARTEAAIRQFQEKTGLQATGRIDEPLIRALLDRKDA